MFAGESSLPSASHALRGLWWLCCRALFQQELSRLGIASDAVHIYTSPFSRTVQTAQIAAEAADLGQECIKVTPLLRERFFGTHLELQCHDNYCPAWEGDARDPTSKPAGNVDGESVAEVSERIQQLFQELEQQHKGQHILLVSHGDTLSILQATFLNTLLTQHRQYGLGTAELKKLDSGVVNGEKSSNPAAVAVTATASS
eukprot:GHUV01029346.1.p1 GENE.GHUV01029346.1~~GHUV01029346.1.p1  ORF type:complete len:201 (+),score=46.90 GHUV01029346.1:325-927(+)